MQRYLSIVDALPRDGIEFVMPACDWQEFEPSPLPAASEGVLAFVAALSRRLVALGNQWPDLAALGFWLRPAAVRSHLAAYGAAMPLGLTFQLVPSNVPTLAVFSWLMALLMGNSSILRLSQRQDPVQQQLLAVCADLLAEPEWRAIASRVRFIRYPHDEQLTARFSALCQLRVIWGGDRTVQQIRAIALAPQARELVFPDRRSLALLSGEGLARMSEAELALTCSRLAQDISQFNQQACASPTTLVWLGETDEALRERLYRALAEPFLVEPAWGMTRLVNGQLAVAQGEATVCRTQTGLTLLSPTPDGRTPRVGGGVLLEQEVLADSAEQALALWLARGENVQTCVCVGMAPARVRELGRQYPATRMDRVVVPGQALAFDWHWDGQDLLAAMSRQTY